MHGRGLSEAGQPGKDCLDHTVTVHSHERKGTARTASDLLHDSGGKNDGL